MRRYTNLFREISARPTLAYAALRAAQGKRHRFEVQAFFRDYEERLACVGAALSQRAYAFSPYREFSIRDPKSRTIHAPTFQDRVVHHAMIRIVGPIFELGAIEHSFACRQGKGLHLALETARRWIQPGDWFFKVDVRKYYDSVSHAILRSRLRRRFREAEVLSLFDSLLASYQSGPERGLPIGALTSQYLGNFYLDEVDRWVKQTMRVRRYMRYMDDLLFIGPASELRAVQRRIGPLMRTLDLVTSKNSQLNRCELGAPWLGFTIYPNRVRLNLAGRKRLRRRTKTLEQLFLDGVISETELQQRVGSMFAHASFADDIRWRRGVCRGSLLRGS